MTSAGKLRHRIVIEQPTKTRDPYGAEVETWTPFATVWAAVEPLRGREFFAAQQVNAEVTHRVTLRYIPGVIRAMRVTFKGRILDMVSPPINVDERNQELQLMCVEVA